MTDNDIETIRATCPGWTVVRTPDEPSGVCLWPCDRPQPDFGLDHGSYAAINFPEADRGGSWEAWTCEDEWSEGRNFATLLEAVEYATGPASDAVPTPTGRQFGNGRRRTAGGGLRYPVDPTE